jgi:hypothetical protein
VQLVRGLDDAVFDWIHRFIAFVAAIAVYMLAAGHRFIAWPLDQLARFDRSNRWRHTARSVGHAARGLPTRLTGSRSPRPQPAIDMLKSI